MIRAPKALCRRRGPAGSPSRGSTLIMVLWVVGLLSLFVASFAFDAHIEARIVSYYRKRAKADALAESGLEVVEWLLRRAQEAPAGAPGSGQTQTDPVSQVIDVIRGGAEVHGAVLHVRLDAAGQSASQATLAFEFGGKPSAAGADLPEGPEYGRIILGIKPKPGKRNVNNLNLSNNDVSNPANEIELEENLERILEQTGVDPALWEDYIDPFIDWIDPDGHSREPANPAETEDWYEDLGYAAKDGPLETIDEMRLIKYFDDPIVQTGEDGAVFTNPPVAVQVGSILTTYGDGKVNINAARTNVLLTVPYMTEENAQAIYAEVNKPDPVSKRPLSPFKDWGDVSARVPNLDARLQRYFAYVSNEFEITSAGECQGVRKAIECVVEFDRSRKKLKIKEWREDL